MLVGVGFSLLTLALTYPQVRVLSTHMGTHYDTFFSVWRLAWFAHQLPRDPWHLFDANIFYPEKRTLAYSDALLLPSMLGAPLIWAGVSAVLVHNLLVLFSFVACGVAMYALVVELTRSRPAAWVAGAIYAFQPYRFGHYAQLELLWGWPIPLALLAFHRLCSRQRVRDGVWLGLAIGLQVWSCLYYAVFLCTGLAVLAVVLAAARHRSVLLSLFKPLLAAALVSTAVAGAYAVAYVGSGRTVGLRNDRDVLEWSPTLVNYIATPVTNWLYGATTGRYGHLEGILFPGIAALILALFGSFQSIQRRRLAYLVLLLVSFDLSLGLHGFLYRGLYSLVWIYRGLRVPARMFVIVSAALAVLAGYGVARLLTFVPRRSGKLLATPAIFGLVVLESASMPIDLRPAPRNVPAVYTWLRDQPPAVVMEWPLPRASGLGYTQAPLYMYYSTFHWQKLVNGYSGFYPASYIELLETVHTLPSPTAVAFMRKRSVRYLILHGEFEPRLGALTTALAASGDFEPVASTRDGEGSIAIFRLRYPPDGAVRVR